MVNVGFKLKTLDAMAQRIGEGMDPSNLPFRSLCKQNEVWKQGIVPGIQRIGVHFCSRHKCANARCKGDSLGSMKRFTVVACLQKHRGAKATTLN
jgi:hypothetical protein